MLTVQTLRSRPARFRSFTGVSVEQFDQLVLDVTRRYAAGEERRLFRPNRQRHIGAGRKFSRPLSERLMLSLVWLRVYTTYEVLGALFEVDKGTVCHWLRALLPLLRETTAVDLQWPDPDRPKRDWADLLRDLRAQGLATTDIADRLEVPPGTIYRWLVLFGLDDASLIRKALTPGRPAEAASQ